MWFNSTPKIDKDISLSFSSLLSSPPDISTKLSHMESIGYILLYDQITRHVNRGNDALISSHLEISLPFAIEFYENNKPQISSKEFPFVMLPLRHTKRYDLFLFTVKETWDKIKNSISQDEQTNYIRFLKASYERYVKLSLDKDYEGGNIILHEPITRRIISEELKEILDGKCKITELVESTLIDNDKIHKIINYLDPTKHYILSLSGGVDSMVLSYILYKKRINFTAVHISYCNREECSQEVQFLKEWCDIIQVKLFYRKIYEINRKDCMNFGLRELYEEYTRDIRFNTYKLVGQMVNPGSSDTFVLLGHNKNDRFENIFTNIAANSHYDNLTGMELIQNVSGINFYRPLLNTTKEDIYEFAELVEINHLPNSTPSWSQRGKIRDQVKPTLISWNPVVIDSFFKLSEKLGSYVKFIESLADNTAQELKKKGFIIFNIGTIPKMENYWLHVFHMNNIWLSTKSNINWIEKINYIGQKFHTIELNSPSKFNLTKDKQIVWKKINSEEIQIILS
jgi:tRNA(Ile)-lysidine synthetase-like protein